MRSANVSVIWAISSRAWSSSTRRPGWRTAALPITPRLQHLLHQRHAVAALHVEQRRYMHVGNLPGRHGARNAVTHFLEQGLAGEAVCPCSQWLRF